MQNGHVWDGVNGSESGQENNPTPNTWLARFKCENAGSSYGVDMIPYL